MSRYRGEVMSTTAKPMQLPPSQPQEVKVFYRPRFGIKAQGRGLSVDVSACQEKDQNEEPPQRG
jgi:hypothetical protein